MYKEFRTSSYYKSNIAFLSADNHITALPQNEWCKINKEYYPVDSASKDAHGRVHSIVAWNDSLTAKDSDEKPLNIVVYSDTTTEKWEDGENIYWEPFIESLLRREVFNKGISKYTEGYVDGRYSHFGAFTPGSFIVANKRDYYDFVQKYEK